MKKTIFLIPGMLSLLVTSIQPAMANPADAQKQVQQIKAENRQFREEMKSKRQLELEAVKVQRSSFRTELAQLKAQKKAAAQSGNVDQAKAYQAQIKQLKAKHKDEAKQARAEFKANRQKYLEARKAGREELKALKQDAKKD